MPRSGHSPRKTQSLYISNGGGGGGGRITSPDLLLSSDHLHSTLHLHPAAPPTRPLSLHGGDTTTHSATYLYSCHPSYTRYYGSVCGGVVTSCSNNSNNSSSSSSSGVSRMREVSSNNETREDGASPGPEGSTTSSSSSTSSTGRGSSGGQDELFHSPHHAKVALRRMEDYYTRGQLCDVTLVAGGRRIRAHRLVLSAASDYFAAMFTSPVLEATQEEVALRDMDAEALLTLVNYCYTGSLELHEDTVEVVLSTAHHLLLTEVVGVCCEYLAKQLHPANCLGIQLFADTQGCSELHRLASKFTAEHFEEVMQHQEFVQLPPDEAARLLASDDLNVPSEELIFQALVLWLKHDLEGRNKEMARLLALVKLPLLSPQFLTDHIGTSALFREDRDCQELLMEALKYHLLPERRSALQSPRTHPRKSTVGTLYVVGGMDANKGSMGIEQYSLRKDTWSSAGTMNGRRLQCGVAVVEGRLLLVGGRDGLKTLNTAEAWDPNSNTWTPLPPMSTHRHGLGVGVLDRPLYAVGGHDGWSYLNTVERWDPQARQWSYVSPMSTARSTVGVAVLNGRLYAVGGRDGSSCLRTVESYDPHTNKWTPCAPMARRRGGVAVGVLNGFLYAVGGHDAPASNPCASRFDCVERYDPATDTWTQVACLSVGCDSAGVSPLGGRLLVVGGYDGQTYLDKVHAYDPHTNEWSQMAALPTGRAGACVVVVGSQNHL